MRRHFLVMVISAVGLIVAACGSTQVADVTALAYSDEIVPVEVGIGAESGVREYFAAIDWLSEPTPGVEELIPDHFPTISYLEPDGEYAQGPVRHDGRGTWWFPMFLALDDEAHERSNITTQTHPVISYDYECSDGRLAYATHFVHDTAELRKSWTRDDYLGMVERDPDTGEASLTWREGERVMEAFLNPTGQFGPFAGAEFLIRPIEDPDEPPPFLDPDWVSYGFYQYFSFTDADGVEVEVQISAPSFDFPDGWQDLDDPSPTIFTGGTEVLELAAHPRVQSRFECGRELAERIAPIINGLHHSE